MCSTSIVPFFPAPTDSGVFGATFTAVCPAARCHVVSCRWLLISFSQAREAWFGNRNASKGWGGVNSKVCRVERRLVFQPNNRHCKDVHIELKVAAVELSGAANSGYNSILLQHGGTAKSRAFSRSCRVIDVLVRSIEQFALCGRSGRWLIWQVSTRTWLYITYSRSLGQTYCFNKTGY